jgi:hypothetical protein
MLPREIRRGTSIKDRGDAAFRHAMLLNDRVCSIRVSMSLNGKPWAANFDENR